MYRKQWRHDHRSIDRSQAVAALANREREIELRLPIFTPNMYVYESKQVPGASRQVLQTARNEVKSSINCASYTNESPLRSFVTVFLTVLREGRLQVIGQSLHNPKLSKALESSHSDIVGCLAGSLS